MQLQSTSQHEGETFRGSLPAGSLEPALPPDPVAERPGAERLLQASPARLEERLDFVVERGARYLTSVVGLFLVGFVIIALAGAVVPVWRALVEEHNDLEAVLDGLDMAFLAIILLELVETTRSQGPMTRRIREFIAIGITAGVRSGLEIAARSRDGSPRDLIIAVVLNSVGVMVLAAAWWLVRQHHHAE